MFGDQLVALSLPSQNLLQLSVVSLWLSFLPRMFLSFEPFNSLDTADGPVAVSLRFQRRLNAICLWCLHDQCAFRLCHRCRHGSARIKSSCLGWCLSDILADRRKGRPLAAQGIGVHRHKRHCSDWVNPTPLRFVPSKFASHPEATIPCGCQQITFPLDFPPCVVDAVHQVDKIRAYRLLVRLSLLIKASTSVLWLAVTLRFFILLRQLIKAINIKSGYLSLL